MRASSLVALRPGMDGKARAAEGFGYPVEVVWVAGEDAVVQTDGDHHEVRIDDIARRSECQELSQGPSVIERVDGDRLQEGSEACLGGTVPPHLGDHCVGRVQGGPGSGHRGEQVSCLLFAAVDRDQEAGVKDQRS